MEQPPFAKWASLIGDFVHNLRTALDHVAYELVRSNRPSAEFSEFPIFKDRGLWETDHTKKLPGVSPKVVTQAKWLQPYRRGQDRDPLWIVHKLDIIDKHRRLHLVNSALEATGWNAIGGTLADIEARLGPFEDGAVVARYRVIPSRPQMEVHTQFTFGIAFGQGEPAEGEYVLPALEVLRVYTGSTIARFERFLA